MTPHFPADTPAPTSLTATRFAPFGTTIFAEMSQLAHKHNAINLSQGFPDFDGPDFIKDAAVKAITAGKNQYAPTGGTPNLAQALADRWQADTGFEIDPAKEVTVTSGCTEALAATFLGLINPGDEVIIFEPFYDSYRACVAMAGGTPRFVQLKPNAETGRFEFDEDDLRAAFTNKTKILLLNTPHNPTGKVFTRAELTLIAELCIKHNIIVVSDEVYEHLVFDAEHIRIATLPGMADRTLTLSSLGKTFSLTGWKIGWAIGSPPLTKAVRAAHQFLTYATATPLQHAAAQAISNPGTAITDLVAHYREARDYLGNALAEMGFDVFMPDGTYFIMADHTRLSEPLGLKDDAEFCRHLTTKIGVAAIPPSSFYANPKDGHKLVRFAFCKQHKTLQAAVERLQQLKH